MNQAYQLNYQIQTSPQGVTLKIWETLGANDEARIRRGSDFLFRLNFRVHSTEAAQEVLQRYLKLIGSLDFDIEEASLDQTVAVMIYPAATEEVVTPEIYPYDRNFNRMA
jgi:hypothetical protein